MRSFFFIREFTDRLDKKNLVPHHSYRLHRHFHRHLHHRYPQTSKTNTHRPHHPRHNLRPHHNLHPHHIQHTPPAILSIHNHLEFQDNYHLNIVDTSPSFCQAY